MRVNLRDYQRKALDLILKKKRIILVLPTGAGKTIIGIEAIRILKKKSLIIVPTITLLHQWMDKLATNGIIAGVYYSKKKDIKDITVITYSSANMVKFLKKLDLFELIILDEAHNIVRYKQLMERLLFWKGSLIGLTATPVDLLEELGEIIRLKTTDELISEGYLADYDYEVITIPLQESLRRKINWNTMSTRDWIKLSIRREVVDTIRRILKNSYGRTIIFTRTKAEAAILGYLLKVPPITADVPLEIKRRLVNLFREGKIDKLITAKTLEEGFDLGNINNIIIVSGTMSDREFIQRLGRALRPKPKAKIWEITISSRKRMIERRFRIEF